MLITSSLQSTALAEELPITLREINANVDDPNYVPGRLIVGLATPDPQFNEKASAHSGQVITSIDQINAHVVKVPINNEEQFIDSMLKNPNVLYVEHDLIVNAFDIPNDPLYHYQWGTQRIGMESVWSSNFDEGSGTMIAVLDEGIYDHTDFFGVNILFDQGWDFADDDNDPIPDKNCNPFPPIIPSKPEEHGTLVTGVIASAINDNFGLAGVGNFDILPVKVLNECGGGFASDVAAGIVFAADSGADVINLSLGAEPQEWPDGQNGVNAMHSAVQYATAYPAEVIIVAASGNDGDNSIPYPAGFPEVITVGATKIDDTIASYSQFGDHLDLAGPGGPPPEEGICDSVEGVTFILTTGVITTGVDNGNGNTTPDNPSWEYACVAGTSFASPYVAAVAGLVKNANPSSCITNEDIQSHLEQTAEDLGSPGWDQYFGYGLVRADSALSTPVSFIPCIPEITLNGVNPQIINVNSTYNELGATAFDTQDGDITHLILIDSSAVVTSTPGNYTVTYDVTDSEGNAAPQAVRDIIVQDTAAPIITLAGANPQIIEAGDTYTELGASAFDDEDGDITASIVTDSSAVVTSTPGNYIVTYDVTDSEGNAATQAIRNVIVQDTTAPEIALTGANPQIIEAGNGYTELGATASDTLEGNLTASIVTDSSAVDTSTPGNYIVTYDVSDSSGNAATQAVRDVTVQDTTAPEIALTGANPQIIDAGAIYVELGATAYDTLEGNLTASIVTDSSAVDTSTPGNYIVTYDVTDSSGNPAIQAIRTVTVQDLVAPNTIHVGDLNWQATDKRNWNAKVFITIHDQDENSVSDVVVQGTFTGDGIVPVNCITDSLGTCQVSISTKLSELIFSVTSISATNFDPSNGHHDPDGDFVGEPIVTILKGINSIGTVSDGGGSGGSGSGCSPGKQAQGKC